MAGNETVLLHGSTWAPVGVVAQWVGSGVAGCSVAQDLVLARSLEHILDLDVGSNSLREYRQVVDAFSRSAQVERDTILCRFLDDVAFQRDTF